MPTIQDQRTPDHTPDRYPWLVVGTDSFLSGWGGAAGGASYAAWACTADDVDTVERWIRDRSDMRRVRVVRADGYRPGRGCAQLTIYPVTPDHPARQR